MHTECSTIKKGIIPCSILLIMFLMGSKNVFAQASKTTYQLSGKIVDSLSQQPLSLVRIILTNEKTQSISLTKDSGTFIFNALQAGTYQLHITAAGYQKKQLTIELQGKNKFHLICLKPVLISLKEVSVRINKAIIQLNPDKIIYDVQADPESKGSNVMTMMRKIPFISIDGTEQILLKGSNSYQILINGKSSSMLNGNLSAILRSMPAVTIQKIEVITSPSSKYDAEGLGGIINIITNKKANVGYSGTLNVNASTPAAGPGTGSSFTIKIGKLGISTFAGASSSHSPKSIFSNERLSMGTTETSLYQQGWDQSCQRNAYLGVQTSYEIDSLNLIFSQFNLNGRGTSGTQNLTSSLAEANKGHQDYDLQNHNKTFSLGMDAAINYQLEFKSSKAKLLNFGYQISSNPTDQHTGLHFFNQTGKNYRNQQQSVHTNFKEQTLHVDFVNQLKTIKTEFGAKAIFRKNSSNFQYQSLNEMNDPSEEEPALSDQYFNTQNVFSAYNTYFMALKQWDFSVGVRYEHTMIRTNSHSSSLLIKQDYYHLVPALAISKRFKNQSSLNLTWSQRIRRPGINRINPYIDRSNPNLVLTGNPNLRPVLSNSLQAGYHLNKKVSMNIGLDYSFMNNLDLKVTNYEPKTQISSITFANVGKARSLGLNYNLSYPLTTWYHLGINGQIMYLWLSGPSYGEILDNNHCIYFMAFSNAIQAGKGWRINADLNVIGPSPNGLQGNTSGLISTAFGLNKEIIKNKLGFAAGIRNPFGKYRNLKNEWTGVNFQQTSISREYFRSFNISLNYQFGGLKEGIRKSRNEVKNNDLSN